MTQAFDKLPPTTREYIAKRDGENRAACTSCGTSDHDCTVKVFTQGEGCCKSCYSRDTHPAPVKLEASAVRDVVRTLTTWRDTVKMARMYEPDSNLDAAQRYLDDAAVLLARCAEVIHTYHEIRKG